MSLGYDQPLFAQDSSFARELKDPMVVLLNGDGLDRRVIKVETGGFSEEEMPFDWKIMGVIDRDAKAEPLTRREADQLDKGCAEYRSHASLIDGLAALPPSLGTFPGGPGVTMKALKRATLGLPFRANLEIVRV